MRRRRAARDERAATTGRPAIATQRSLSRSGNLTMAMGITLGENRLDLLGARLFIEDRGIDAGAIAWGPRIGIRVGTDTPWRAWIAGHPAVSATRDARPRRTRNRTGVTEPG